MGNCNDYIIKMNMYLDGELPANQISDLMQHLDQCESCRKRFDGLKITAFEMRQMTSEPPDMLHGSIMHFVRENSASTQRKKWAQKLITVAACAAFLIMAASGSLSHLTGVFIFGSSDEMRSMVESDVENPGNAPAAFNANKTVVGESNQVEQNAITPRSAGATYDESSDSREEAYNYDPFVMPKLSTSENACYYVVVTGDAALEDIFPVEDVFHSETGGESYVFVSGGLDTKDGTEELLADEGFIIHCNAENLPETDLSANFGLVVCFKSQGKK